MFGMRIVTKKSLEKIEQAAKNRALAELVAFLRRKDRIFIEPVTLVGDHQLIQNCVFIDTTAESPALTIIDWEDYRKRQGWTVGD